jgi:NitT/TauT family transport system substrate-binding protein
MGPRTIRVFGMVGAGLLVTLGAGCAGNHSAAPPAVEKHDITVGAVPVTDMAGLYIALDQGLFQKVGLNVKIDPIVSSADAATGQNNGTYDITAGNSVSYIQQQQSGHSDLEIVAEGSLMQPGNQALYTLPGSKITNLADLAGKRIGVNALNNIGTLLISSVLEEDGIPPNDVHFKVVNFPDMAQALQSHQIDAAWLPEPFGSADVASFGLQQLADLDQGAAMSFPVGWYVVTRQWAQKYPHTLAAFLDALKQGQQIADTDRGAVEKAMESLPGPYAVPSMIASIMSLETYPLDTAPGIDAVRVQRVAEAMYQFHLLTTPFKTSSMLG